MLDPGKMARALLWPDWLLKFNQPEQAGRVCWTR
jgi:hypothetical protein